MTVIKIDTLGTTTISSTTSTIENTVEDGDLKSTTYTGLTTSLTTAGSSKPHVDIYMANSYLDSLSDTQIVQMEKMLEEKENLLLQVGDMQVEIPTVEQLQQPKTQNLGQEKPKVYQKAKNI